MLQTRITPIFSDILLQGETSGSTEHTGRSTLNVLARVHSALQVSVLIEVHSSDDGRYTV